MGSVTPQEDNALPDLVFPASPHHHECSSGDDCCVEQSSKKYLYKGQTSQSNLRERYLDFSYVLKLVFNTTDKQYCQCGECQKQFQTSAQIERLRDGLRANWASGVNRKDRKRNLTQDLLVGLQYVEGQKPQQLFLIDGIKVCKRFFIAARGYSNGSIQRAKDGLLNGEVSASSIFAGESKTAAERPAPKREGFVGYVKKFAKSNGDYMPHEDAIVLPYAKFEGVFLEYQAEWRRRGWEPCHYSWAVKIFNEDTELENIRLVRTKGTLSACKVCTNYQMRILKAKSDHERNELKRLRQEHVDKQRRERVHYYQHREEAFSNSEQVLSLIIDGMDQNKTNIPLLSRTTSSSKVVKQRVIGVKVHAVQNYVYLVDDTVQGGGNLIIEVLRRTLLDLEKDGKLPCKNPTLYVQMDNCSENKNRTVFAFFNDLVEKDVFEELYAGFLMVGHTHEDIDQFFSIIAKHLSKWETICPDIESLKQEILKAFATEKLASECPKIFEIHAPEVFDCTTFYQNHINQKLAQHTIPHQYRFKKFDGTVLCHYKMWAAYHIWLPANGETNMRSIPSAEHDVTEDAEVGKKRKLVRGNIKPKAKKALKDKTHKISSLGNDIEKEDDYALDMNTGLYEEEYQEELELAAAHQGVRWLMTYPVGTPPFVKITDEKAGKNLKFAQSMMQFVEKSQIFNPAIFSEVVVANWANWLKMHQNMWNDVKRFQNESLCSYQFPSSFKDRAGGEELERNIIGSSEPILPGDGVEVIVHDSGSAGSFDKMKQKELVLEQLSESNLLDDNYTNEIEIGKFCIYMWGDLSDDGETEVYFISVGKIDQLVSGAATGKEGVFNIRYCPGKKNRATPRIRLSAQKTFDQNFKKRDEEPISRGNKGKLMAVIDKNISRQSILAFNLHLTRAGKFDNRRMLGEPYLGLTSYEVAEMVIGKFNTSCAHDCEDADVFSINDDDM